MFIGIFTGKSSKSSDLKQGVSSQSVGSVYFGIGTFAYGKTSFYASHFQCIVYIYTTHGIVCHRFDGDEFCGRIHMFMYLAECHFLRQKIHQFFLSQMTQIQEYPLPLFDLCKNGTCHFITRFEFINKTFSFFIEQVSAFPARRFRDENRRVFQRSRMKLYEFHI